MNSRDGNQVAEEHSLVVANQFPLLRRLSIASLATMLVTATILVLLYRQDQLTEHNKISAQRNEQVALQLVRLLGNRINILASSSDGLNAQALRNNLNLDLFPSAPEMARDYDILKLKIYNPSGAIIYSSVREEIGEASRHPDLLAKALAGETTDRLEFRDTFLGASGEMHDIYVANTFRPLVYAGKRIGAIEIYRDSTPVFAHLNANTIRIPLIIFGGFTLLYAALFFYVRRTDHTLADWQKALLESEKRQHMLEQQKLVQTSLDGFFVARVGDARIIEANDAFCGMVGYSREELLTLRISDLEANESPAETAAHIRKIMEIGYDRFETRHRHKQGYPVDLELSVSHSKLDSGTNFVFARDITARKFAAQYEQFRSHTLELLSGGCSLEDILEGIVRGVEQLDPAMMCSILLLDSQGKYLGKGIAPSLPDFYNAAIEGLEIGIGVGSCGTAAATGERVIVEDIKTHPYWSSYKEIALKAGLGACWSQPILSSSGRVLGTFAIYHRETHSPSASDIVLIEKTANLASIAIERKQSEALLVQREQEFRSLAENLPDNIARWDREGRYLYLNPVHELTLRKPAAEILGKRPGEIFSDGRFDRAEQVLAQVAETGQAQFIRVPAPQEDGSLRIHEVSYVPERNAQGEIVSVLGIGRDMTEQIRLQEAIIHSEAALRSLTDSAPFSIIRYDIEGRITYVNAPLLGFFGIPLAELIGKRPREVWMDGRFAEIDRGIAQVLKTKAEVVVEFSELSAEGKTLHHQIWIVPDKDASNEVFGIIAFGLDTTERKQAESLLIQREREFRTLAENMPDNIVRYNREGVTVYVNPVLERTLGDLAVAMIGTTPREYHPDGSYEDYAQLLDTVLASGEAGELEKILPGPDGETRVHQIRMVPECGENGEMVGVLAIGRDITERKHAERQLRKLTAHLQTVREEEKNHLAREIHDDLGSTLAALKIEAHQLDHGLSAKQKATPLFARVESMVNLLDDALATTRRIITDLRPPQLDDLGLLAALKWQAEQFHERSAIECRIACSRNEDCDSCFECAGKLDEAVSITLFRIFQESLTNVARHSGASRVEVEFQPGHSEIVLSISDNGRGLPQGHAIAATSYGIRGMRERVEQLGGKIEFDSPLGGGFSVMVRLPQPAVVR